MSKKKTQAEQPQKPEQPAYVEELLTKGTVILRASCRDEFGEMIDTIPASVRYSVGGVGRNRNSGLFELRLDIINE